MSPFRILYTLVLGALVCVSASAAEYHVNQGSKDAADTNPGSADKPLKAIQAAAKLVEAGDTVTIHEGVYRELVEFRKPGTPDKPITIRAAEGQRVIINGADPITGWRKAEAADLGGVANPNLDKLFVVDVDWLPERTVQAGELRLLEKGEQMQVARTPSAGWWGITKGLSLSEFIDEKNLTQAEATAWDGWTVAILEQAGGGIVHLGVKSFDPAAHKITLTRNYSTYRKVIDEKRDRYYMENHIAALNGPGQFVYKTSGKGVRLIAWPRQLGPDQLPQIESPRRSNLVSLRGGNNWVIDGLEVCYSAGHGLGMGGGVPPVGVVIQNCIVHHNSDYAMELRTPKSCTIRRNIIRQNSHGIVMGGSVDCTITENDIGCNWVDGLDAPGGTRNLTLSRNYIHDHYLWGHPDNIQFWTDVQGTTIRDNVMIHSGQTMMSEGMKGTKLINNMWIGSHAVAMICGGDDWEIRNNTVCATGLQPTGFNGKGFTVIANVIAPLRGLPAYSMQDPESFKSDYNLLVPGRGYQGAMVVSGGWKASAASTDEIRQKFKQEAHGLVGEAKFRSAPAAYAVSDYRRTADCTASRFYLSSDAGGLFAAGDNVEINFDGVARKVTKVGSDFIEIDKPLAQAPTTNVSIANWTDRTKILWDLRPAKDSPATGAGPEGQDIGCNLDIQAYMRGDFDGDGKPDLRPIPAEALLP